jgi:hypothetical protein
VQSAEFVLFPVGQHEAIALEWPRRVQDECRQTAPSLTLRVTIAIVMHILAVTILRYVDADYPGWVDAAFRDARGREHVFREKAPVLSTDDLDASSSYPQPGVIACEIISRRHDADGTEIVTVTTERPWGCESVAGEYHFDVLPEQLREESR